MNNGFIRTIIGVLVGIILAFGLVWLMEAAGNAVSPNVYDPASGEILIPVGSTIALLIGWFIGSFAGSWLAMRIAGSNAPGWVVGGAMVGAALYRAWTISDVWWIVLAGLLVPLIATWLAQKAARLSD